MADRPILFSAPMVKALLAGRKTQTRRIIKPRGRCSLFDGSWTDDYVLDPGNAAWRERDIPCAAGDRLWVRETWRTFVSLEGAPPRDLYRPGERGAGVLFKADGGGLAITAGGDVSLGIRDDRAAFGKVRAGIHMPRWASRLTLHVAGVKVERLQEISHDDAVAEGVGIFPHSMSAEKRFREVWTVLHGPDAWDANPWVAAITFRPVLANIDMPLPAPADPLAIGAAT